MKILGIYEDIIDFAGLITDSDKVYIPASKNKEPYLVNGKQLVIPTSNMLRKFNSEENLVFHPLSEDIIKGESPIISKLKYTINIRINIAIGVLVQSLLNLVDSPEYHSTLTPEQSELLYAIKDIDDKTVKNFTSFMMKEVNNKEDRLFVYTYLKRAGTIKDKKYARAAVITFPFYQSLVKGEKYKFRTKDIEAYLAIFKFIFPEIDEPDGYNYGSDSDVAPFLDSLMMSSFKLADRLNELTNRYQKHIDNYESILFNLNWVDDFQHLENFKNEIRSIPTATTLEAPPEPSQPMIQQPMQQLPAYMQQPQQPVQQYQQPELKETNRGLDFNSLKQKMGMQQMPSAFAQPPMGYNPAMMQPRQQPYMGDVLNRPQMQPGMQMMPGMQMQPGMIPMQPNMQMMPQQMQPGMQMMPGMQMQPGMMPMQPGMQMMPQQMQPGIQMQPGMMQPMQAVPMQPGMVPGMMPMQYNR